MIKLAMDMDVDGPENPLQLENAYFECHTLTCTWVQVTGIMDIPSLNEENSVIGQHGDKDRKHRRYNKVFSVLQ